MSPRDGEGAMAAARPSFKCAHPEMAINLYCPGMRKEAETITEVNESGCSEDGPGSGEWGLLFLTSLLCYLFTCISLTNILILKIIYRKRGQQRDSVPLFP